MSWDDIIYKELPSYKKVVREENTILQGNSPERDIVHFLTIFVFFSIMAMSIPEAV
ncbi:hypothetical protein AB205_0185940 [Aquarana catesbeiana]|uniref:Uncharacterized protein n=1 Tax=Aquarana catesbeiana TaxID=8400 RepID=A0A2G9RSZ7_AQUCT|nr:hypothetical protein AB205_0185940 [Aquarana catesbeiana]